MIDQQMDGHQDTDRDITGFMAELARVTDRRVVTLPAPAAILLRARLLRQWEAERRAERPLDAMQSIHVALGVVAAVVLLVWSAPLLRSLF